MSEREKQVAAGEEKLAQLEQGLQAKAAAGEEREREVAFGRLHRLHAAVPAILHHHEHWDGNGYPDGLRGESLPLEAAIVGLADALDAMTTDRPYSNARSLNEATGKSYACAAPNLRPRS